MGGNPRHGRLVARVAPGVLHAYDADDIRRELWNSLEMPARDDCGEYSKMAPPTIANGRVYLASFGFENTGTGQLCVYGLLPVPGAEKLAAPTAGKAELQDGNVMVTWNAVPGAKVYRVQRTSSLEPRPKALAMGLTTTNYVEPAPERGESLSYTIFAVGNDGASEGSASVKVAPQKAVSVED